MLLSREFLMASTSLSCRSYFVRKHSCYLNKCAWDTTAVNSTACSAVIIRRAALGLRSCIAEKAASSSHLQRRHHRREAIMSDQAEPVKRNILLAVDETEASERACDWLVENLLREGDEVHIFHVVAPAEPEMVGSGWDGLIAVGPPDPAVERQWVKEATEYIKAHFVPKLRGAPCKVEIAKSQADADNVGKVLCKRAEDLQAAALVMASHNKGAMQRFFLGSASQHCSRNCTRPVVLLH